jgi:hypothetical protein
LEDRGSWATSLPYFRSGKIEKLKEYEIRSTVYSNSSTTQTNGGAAKNSKKNDFFIEIR